MKYLFIFLLMLVAPSWLPGQGWMNLRNGEKIEIEWASKSGSVYEFVEKGDWKTIPAAEVFNVRFAPGKWSLGLSYVAPIWGDNRKSWVALQEEEMAATNYLSYSPKYDSWIAFDLEFSFRERWGLGGQFWYNQNDLYASFYDYSIYEEPQSLDFLTTWQQFLGMAYGKWYTPDFRFFLTGGLGVEVQVVKYHATYYKGGQNPIGATLQKRYGDGVPVYYLPALHAGAGFFLIQKRLFSIHADLNGLVSGYMPVYVFDTGTKSFRDNREILLASVYGRLTFRFQVR